MKRYQYGLGATSPIYNMPGKGNTFYVDTNKGYKYTEIKRKIKINEFNYNSFIFIRFSFFQDVFLFSFFQIISEISSLISNGNASKSPTSLQSFLAIIRLRMAKSISNSATTFLNSINASLSKRIRSITNAVFRYSIIFVTHLSSILKTPEATISFRVMCTSFVDLM